MAERIVAIERPTVSSHEFSSQTVSPAEIQTDKRVFQAGQECAEHARVAVWPVHLVVRIHLCIIVVIDVPLPLLGREAVEEISEQELAPIALPVHHRNGAESRRVEVCMARLGKIDDIEERSSAVANLAFDGWGFSGGVEFFNSVAQEFIGDAHSNHSEVSV